MLGKVDYALSNKNNLTVQYNMHRWDSPNGVQTQPIISVGAVAPTARTSSRPTSRWSRMNSVLSQRWLNEARVQIGRDFEAQEPNARPVRARR